MNAAGSALNFTSSISVTAIAQGLQRPQRLVGWHFFNPAPRMKLVEIARGLETDPMLAALMRTLSRAWGKTPVMAPNAPGFIVNRVARPFYGEALRLLAEGLASVPAIDRLFTEAGGFALGPFELIDLVQRTKLRQRLLGAATQPLLFRGGEALPELAGRCPVGSLRQHRGGNRLQPVRRRRQRRTAPQPCGGGLRIPVRPVMDEADVVVELPLRWLRRQPLPQQRLGEIGTPRTTRLRLTEEDGAEAIRDVEIRVQRRRQVEQRVKDPVVPIAGGARQPLAAIVLDAADPVEIGRERVETQDEPLHRFRRSQVEHTFRDRRFAAERAVPPDLQQDRDAKQAERGELHLKSRRAKMAVAAVNSAAM